MIKNLNFVLFKILMESKLNEKPLILISRTIYEFWELYYILIDSFL